MSLNHIFAPAYGRNNFGASLQRRICLLQAVFPSFASAANQMYNSTKKFSSARAFWSRFLLPCLILESDRWRFPKLAYQHDELVSRVLKSLEKIIDMKESTIVEELGSSTFPRLETLRKCINDNPSDAEELLPDHVQIVKPIDPQEGEDLVELLAELAKAAKDDSKHPPPEEALPVTSRLKSSITPLLLNLFSTISECCRCQCANPHTLILLLFTHRFIPNKDDSHTFTMLIKRDKPRKGSSWQETGVAIKELMPDSMVQIILPNEPQIDQGSESEALTRVTDLCTTMNNMTTSRLNLNISGESIFQLEETNPQMPGLENVEFVSLAEGLIGNETELGIKSKTCLAVVLSYSLLDFCWEPWFPAGWTRGGINLLQYSRQLLLRPTLVTYICRHTKGSNHLKISNDLKLLLHGILLMEIFKQEALPFQLNLMDITKIDDFRVKARREFDAVRWGVSEGFRQSVEACIDGFPDGHMDNSDDTEVSFASNFYKAVINPLERDFITLWGKKDPDHVLSDLTLPSIPDHVLSELRLPSIRHKKQPPPPNPKPDHLKKSKRGAFSTKTKHSISTSSTQMNHVPIISAFNRLQYNFFDVDDNPDPIQVQGASKWFSRFDQALETQQALQTQQMVKKRIQLKGKGVKIAILDTGINLANSWISTKSGRINCWPSKDSCEDTDGHGTQVAYLIFRLAPLSQLHIAKVSQSKLLQDADINKIAEAIKHFSSDENRVDIINLSFGFPKFHDQLEPIRIAIFEARTRNVLLFAAAGNEGGNQGVFWPAQLLDVIRINAADSYGNEVAFNPSDGAGRRICTLGEATPSCELDTKKNNEWVHRSGTSFATPIAVAIAAIVLGFIDGTDNLGVPKDFEQLKPRLRTRSGMEIVLCKTCVLQRETDRAGFSYITPWFFFEIDELSRLGIITNILRNCPE